MNTIMCVCVFARMWRVYIQYTCISIDKSIFYNHFCSTKYYFKCANKLTIIVLRFAPATTASLYRFKLFKVHNFIAHKKRIMIVLFLWEKTFHYKPTNEKVDE